MDGWIINYDLNVSMLLTINRSAAAAVPGYRIPVEAPVYPGAVLVRWQRHLLDPIRLR